jgi:spore coat polysaccharide biosynthesis protein SpsF
MSTNLFLQARINSIRLPSKVLKIFCNKTLIKILIERMDKINNIDKLILVTGDYYKNIKLINEIKSLNIDYYSGNEENILDRFYNASLKFPSDNIIRVTADNPFTDYDLINHGLKIFQTNNYDILSNNRIKSYPLGLNFEIFTSKALKISWKRIHDKFLNNFFTLEIPPTRDLLYGEKFKNYDLVNDVDLSNIRLTVDTIDDYETLIPLFEKIYLKNPFFTLKNILEHVD